MIPIDKITLTLICGNSFHFFYSWYCSSFSWNNQQRLHFILLSFASTTNNKESPITLCSAPYSNFQLNVIITVFSLFIISKRCCNATQFTLKNLLFVGLIGTSMVRYQWIIFFVNFLREHLNCFFKLKSSRIYPKLTKASLFQIQRHSSHHFVLSLFNRLLRLRMSMFVSQWNDPIRI